MRTRENKQTETLLAGDAAQQLSGGLTVRPISFGTMLVFRRLGHPFGGLAAGAELTLTQEHLAQALWVMCAPWEQVRSLTRGGDMDAVADAVLDFAATVSPEQLAEFTRYLAGEKEAADTAAAVVLPDATRDREPSKN